MRSCATVAQSARSRPSVEAERRELVGVEEGRSVEVILQAVEPGQGDVGGRNLTGDLALGCVIAPAGMGELRRKGATA
jgi:hypothetical protein